MSKIDSKQKYNIREIVVYYKNVNVFKKLGNHNLGFYNLIFTVFAHQNLLLQSNILICIQNIKLFIERK